MQQFTQLKLSSQSNLFHSLQVLLHGNRESNEWITPVTTSGSTASELTSTAEMGSSANRNKSKTEEGDTTVLLNTSFKNLESSLGYDDTELPLPEQIVELLGKLYNIYYQLLCINTN